MRIRGLFKNFYALILIGIALPVFAAADSAQPERPSPQYAPPQPGSSPPPMIFDPRNVPVIQHEKSPDIWPQPDYFAQALKMTNMKADERFQPFFRSDLFAQKARYVIVPVQTQAFGFAPGFRALVGAYLERLLSAGEGSVTRLTDNVDAYGPFARRLDEGAVQLLVERSQDKKLILLYLGHDGVDQAFLTLTVQDAKNKLQKHQTIPLPSDPEEALAAIFAVLPNLASQLKLTNSIIASNGKNSDAACNASVWEFGRPAPAASGLQRACHALAVGTLLPVYEPISPHYDGLLSPAKQFWLADAYAQAMHDASPRAHAIRSLALNQLGLGKAVDAPAAFISVDDPVISLVAKLLARNVRSTNSPAKSTLYLAEKQMQEAVDGLPEFTQALFMEYVAFDKNMHQVDLCMIESLYPGMISKPKCPSGAFERRTQARIASNTEFLLYQDWRIASYYRDISYYGENLGIRRAVLELLNTLPADVAVHPFIQQSKSATEQSTKFLGTMDEFLQHTQDTARSFVQATANIQDYNKWLAGHSLSEHLWTNNLNLLNDRQVREWSDAERRILSVLKFDRFASSQQRPMKRLPGQRAFFLTPSAFHISLAQMYTPAAQPANAVNALNAVNTQKPAAEMTVKSVGLPKDKLFSPIKEKYDQETENQLTGYINENPRDMGARVRLALHRLKDGVPMKDAIKSVDAYPRAERSEWKIDDSHQLATPGHAFYFAAEIEAAKKFYQQSLSMGTSNESELHAAVRLALMENNLSKALPLMEKRLGRYESDYAARDVAALHFMANEPEKGWQTFMPRAASSNTFQLWMSAYVAQRMAGKTLNEIEKWLTANKFEKVQVNREDVEGRYLHLHAVTDRLPTDTDIDKLQVPRGLSPSKKLAVSARLIRSAMEQKNMLEAHHYALSSLSPYSGDANDFILPFYAWVAWQATDGKDENLRQTLQADVHQHFDHVLAKSMILSLQGEYEESLRYFRAARYELSTLGMGYMHDIPVPAPYQYALAGYLMYKKTNVDSYRIETLGFLRAYQKVFPFFGWLYSMEAVLERDVNLRGKAICKARFLDPQSYFLKVAAANSKNQAVCKNSF